MDRTQLLTIVITAVVSVVAKELITWLVALMKGTSAVATTRAKLKVIFSKSNLSIMVDVFTIIFYGAVLVNFARADSTPTRLEILIVIGAVLALIVMSVALLIDIAKAMHAKKSAP